VTFVIALLTATALSLAQQKVAAGSVAVVWLAIFAVYVVRHRHGDPPRRDPR
jgi:hypothetical protein